MNLEVLHTSEHFPQLRFSHRSEVSEKEHERTPSILRGNETWALDCRARGTRRKQKKDGEQMFVHPFFGHEVCRQLVADVEQGGVVRVRVAQHHAQR